MGKYYLLLALTHWEELLVLHSGRCTLMLHLRETANV